MRTPVRVPTLAVEFPAECCCCSAPWSGKTVDAPLASPAAVGKLVGVVAIGALAAAAGATHVPVHGLESKSTPVPVCGRCRWHIRLAHGARGAAPFLAAFCLLLPTWLPNPSSVDWRIALAACLPIVVVVGILGFYVLPVLVAWKGWSCTDRAEPIVVAPEGAAGPYVFAFTNEPYARAFAAVNTVVDDSMP